MQRALLAFLILSAACTSGAVVTPTTETLPPITTTSTTLPSGPGRCGAPLLTDEQVPDTQLTDELIARFVADRRGGVGAEGCLSDAALLAFADSAFPLCLYACSDIAQIDLPDAPSIRSEGDTTLGPVRSVLVDYQIEDKVHRRMREIYKVQTVRGPGDSRQVLIDSVSVEPETMISETAGRQVIDDLLAALAADAWDIAGSLLVNQGTTAAIEARLPDVYGTPWDQLLEPFCAVALCRAPYEILANDAVEAQRRTFQVRFESNEGPVETEIPVVAFEGAFTVGDLPPDGDSDVSAVSIKQQLFRDEPPDRFALIRYDTLQLGDTWLWWPSARNAPDAQTIAGRVLFTGFGGVRLATYESGTVEVKEIIAADPWRLAGVAMIQESPTALLTDSRRVVAYDLEDRALQPLVDLGGERTVGCASVGGDRMLVTSGIGDSASYDLYRLDDLVSIAHFEPDKASGCGILSPDGTTFAYTADVSLHNPQTIVLASAVSGSDIDRWSVLEDAVLTDLAFDGHYATARLLTPPQYVAYVQSDSLGRDVVVDTQTGDQWTVDTAVHVLFPPG